MTSVKLAILLVAFASVARADGDKEAAKTAYVDASRHYDLREYAAAIEGFRRAYTLLPDPLFLFDIAQSYRQLHDCDNARGFYRNYLTNAPNADNRDKVEQFITEMDACVTQQELERAKHERDRPSHDTLKLAGVVTGGAGVVLLGVAAYYSLDAADKARRLEQQCAGGCDAVDTVALDSSGRAAGRNAVVLYVLGGAALAAGIGMFGWAALDEPAVAVTPLPGGAAVSTQVRF